MNTWKAKLKKQHNVNTKDKQTKKAIRYSKHASSNRFQCSVSCK